MSAAIGLEVLRLYTEGGLLANGQAQALRFANGLNSLLDHPLVGDSRHAGLLGAVELVADKATRARFDPALHLADRIFDAAARNKIIFRAFGDNILGFAPALCYTAGEVDMMVERVRKTLDEVLESADVRRAIKS